MYIISNDIAVPESIISNDIVLLSATILANFIRKLFSITTIITVFTSTATRVPAIIRAFLVRNFCRVDVITFSLYVIAISAIRKQNMNVEDMPSRDIKISTVKKCAL